VTTAVGKLKEQESMGTNNASTVALTSNHVVKGHKVGMGGIKNRGSQIHKVKTKYSRKFKISKKYDCQEEEMEDKKKSQKQIEQLRSYLKKPVEKKKECTVWKDEVEEDKKKTDEDDIAQK